MNLLLLVMKSFSEAVLQMSPHVSLARIASHALPYIMGKGNEMTIKWSQEENGLPEQNYSSIKREEMGIDVGLAIKNTSLVPHFAQPTFKYILFVPFTLGKKCSHLCKIYPSPP